MNFKHFFQLMKRFIYYLKVEIWATHRFFYHTIWCWIFLCSNFMQSINSRFIWPLSSTKISLSYNLWLKCKFVAFITIFLCVYLTLCSISVKLPPNTASVLRYRGAGVPIWLFVPGVFIAVWGGLCWWWKDQDRL